MTATPDTDTSVYWAPIPVHVDYPGPAPEPTGARMQPAELHIYFNEDTATATLVVVWPLGSGRPPTRLAGAADVDYLHTCLDDDDTVQVDVQFTDTTRLPDAVPAARGAVA